MFKKLTYVLILMLLLTGCKSKNTDSQVQESPGAADDTNRIEEDVPADAPVADTSITLDPEANNSQTTDYSVYEDLPITIVNPVNGESIDIYLNETKESVVSKLLQAELDINSYPIQTSTYTLIDQLDIARSYQSTEEASSRASIEEFIIDIDNYQFLFLNDGTVNRLTGVTVFNTLAPTIQMVRNGDNADTIIEAYGEPDSIEEYESGTSYIYKDSHNLTFIIDYETNIITSWSVSVYSHEQEFEELSIWEDLSSPLQETTIQ